MDFGLLKVGVIILSCQYFTTAAGFPTADLSFGAVYSPNKRIFENNPFSGRLLPPPKIIPRIVIQMPFADTFIKPTRDRNIPVPHTEEVKPKNDNREVIKDANYNVNKEILNHNEKSVAELPANNIEEKEEFGEFEELNFELSTNPSTEINYATGSTSEYETTTEAEDELFNRSGLAGPAVASLLG